MSMRKFMYVIYVLFGIICFFGCLTAAFREDMLMLGLSTFSMFFCFITAFIAEEREEKKHDERCQSWGIGMLILVTAVGAMFLLSSCSTSGYGCKGRSSCITRVR